MSKLYNIDVTNEQWNEIIKNFRIRLINIQVPNDVTPDRGKYILSQLDDIYSEIRILYGDVMKLVKDCERVLYRVEHKARMGSNDSDRKKNGIVAAENTNRNNDVTPINLFEIEIDLNNKKEDLESLLDIIKSKNGLVITMSGLLKIESNIAGR